MAKATKNETGPADGLPDPPKVHPWGGVGTFEGGRIFPCNVH